MRRNLLKPETFCEIVHVKIYENSLPFTEKIDVTITNRSHFNRNIQFL